MKQNPVAPILFSLCLTFGSASGAAAQDAVPDEAVAIDDVVVTARRAGAPMWEISRGDSTLIVVGAIDGLPRDLDWRPEALEAAAVRSHHILFPQQARASVADLGRVIWRARSIVLLPENMTVADYVPEEDVARLETALAEDGRTWRRHKLFLLSDDLLEQAGYRPRDLDVADVVRRAGRRVDVPMRSVGVIRGDEFIEMLISSPQSRHLPCLQAALTAAEAGPAAGAKRAEDWRSLRVAAVVANPLEQAVGQCWPYGDPDVGVQITAEWLGAIETSLRDPGVTLAVAPLRILAEPGGVLDQLEAQGLDVVGPPWKAEAAAPQ